MKKTIDVPDRVLGEVMPRTGLATGPDTVAAAVEDLNRRARLRELADQLGKSDTFMNVDELFAMRSSGDCANY